MRHPWLEIPIADYEAHMMKNMDYQTIFSEIADELKTVENSGAVAAYIPELSNVDPGKNGNSFKGMKALEFLTTKTQSSIV